jgi:two-component system cell cycle response regulator
MNMMTSTDLKQARILIIDDCADSANLLAELLTQENYRIVHVTTDAAVVCDLHELNNYDLILLDMHMPYVSGFEVMTQLRRMTPDIFLPVIALTGNNDLRLAALEAGAYDFITKPFDLTEITVRIRNMLEVRLLYKCLEEQSRLQQNTTLYDPLTGLPNRRLAMDRIAVAVEHAKRHRKMTAVLSLDIDGFKLVNDQHDRESGDQLLKQVATQLLRCLRKEDTVARIGGDEFLVVLSEIQDAAGVLRPVQKMLDLFSTTMPLQTTGLGLTTSIGIALHPIDMEDPETLMMRADQALYKAKAAGKNQYCFASSSVECMRSIEEDVHCS